MNIPKQIQDAAIQAFEAIDPLVVAFAPDAPEPMMVAWSELHKLLPAEYVAARDQR
jgi:hypothetical protein